MASTDAEREDLLRMVKKEVKQLMEEAVTRKFVHEESSTITSLCGAVEACLLHGLRKRSLGLFKNSSTTALLQKASKNCPAAAEVVRILGEVEQNNENFKKSVDSNRNQTSSGSRKSPYNPKYLWIRLALFEKQLAKILEYLVTNSSKYYEKDALMMDPCDGPTLATLLVGPCALDYTKMKTPDHYWTDPPADELVQRHRIHSSAHGNHQIRADSPKRPGLHVLQVKRHTSSSSEENMRTVPASAKEYVESLHQNAKSTLLYGKNNVMVQPREDVEPLAGYLSLHQDSAGLSVKWTPNQLMNGCCEKEQDQDAIDRRPIYVKYALGKSQRNGYKKFLYWDFAVTVYIDEIVYLHCHQRSDTGGTIVLVGQDGVQRPPIHFPKGGHLLAFLSCLENGLLPHGQLDPPLWSQRGRVSADGTKFSFASAQLGKVFPKLKRKGSRLSSAASGGSGQSVSSAASLSSMGSVNSMDVDTTSTVGSTIAEEEESTDYVFRIISTFRPDSLPAEMLDPKAKDKEETLKWAASQSKAPVPEVIATPPPPSLPAEEMNSHDHETAEGCRSAVKKLCDTMRRQILSRAFYGWLSHCRHLKTVRTHLSGLVNSVIVAVDDPVDASGGMTVELWNEMSQDGVLKNKGEVYRLVYYGGCSHEVRKEVWPYLLGHYHFNSSAEERAEHDNSIRQQYERTMSEWLAIEAIVRQRDKETMAANLAKLSQESQDGGMIPLVRKDSSLSNDVFESIDSDDFSHPETVPEESERSSVTTPTTERTLSATESQIAAPPAGTVENQAVALAKSADTKDGVPNSPDEGLGDSIARGSSIADSKRSDSCDTDKCVEGLKSESEDAGHEQKSILVTNATIEVPDKLPLQQVTSQEEEGAQGKLLSTSEDGERISLSRESLASPVSNASNGGIYSTELLDSVALNLHRIDKDVQRCDRNYWYFTPANLDKLRNVMCTYVWEHLEVGYVQGMCDLVAPLLVIFDDEAKAYSCFCHLMKRMSSNFPHGGAMDQHFANMRSLIQILDPELFEHMHQYGDYTHFYFCYRWFLLDFKRELVYDDVFAVWETIWAARHISSRHYVLFLALALVQYYRDIIMDNNMDFTDIIKFFNEMAERHDTKQVLRLARELVFKLQDLIDNK